MMFLQCDCFSSNDYYMSFFSIIDSLAFALIKVAFALIKM